MSDQRNQLLPDRARALIVIARPLLEFAWIAIALTLVILGWNMTGAATGEVSLRIFLVGWAAASIVLSVEFLFNDLTSLRRRSRVELRLPWAVHYVAIGAVVGLAVGTTDWTDLRFEPDQIWLQLVLTVPLLLAYTIHLVRLQRSSGE